MKYEGMVIRPPSEADSLLLQITYGCSHNQCTFCGTYPDKPFRTRPFEDIQADIEEVKKYTRGQGVRRIFLCDGDALILSTKKLLRILKVLNESWPDLQRVAIYANARDIIKKSESELKELAGQKLTLAYLGLESGNDQILKRVKKGATAEEMVTAVQKAQAGGIKMSVIGLLGLGGPELTEEHARETARAVSAMKPRYFSLLTLMLVPGTPLAESAAKGEFTVLEPRAMVEEMRSMVAQIDTHNTIFRTNHASNYAPIGGTLNKDKQRILKEIDGYLQGQHGFRPEAFRGL